MPPTMPIFERLAYHGMRRPGRRVAAKASSGLKHNEMGREGEEEEQDVDRTEADHALEALGEPLTWDLARVRPISHSLYDPP